MILYVALVSAFLLGGLWAVGSYVLEWWQARCYGKANGYTTFEAMLVLRRRREQERQRWH